MGTDKTALNVVFDTNIIISALIHGRRLSPIPVLWTSRLVRPLVCRETVTELLTALHYPKFKLDDQKRHDVLGGYLPYARQLSLPDPLPVLPVICRDRKDEAFIHLALAGNADYLVTGDKDLLILRDAIPFQMIAIAELQAALIANGVV